MGCCAVACPHHSHPCQPPFSLAVPMSTCWAYALGIEIRSWGRMPELQLRGTHCSIHNGVSYAGSNCPISRADKYGMSGFIHGTALSVSSHSSTAANSRLAALLLVTIGGNPPPPSLPGDTYSHRKNPGAHLAQSYASRPRSGFAWCESIHVASCIRGPLLQRNPTECEFEVQLRSPWRMA
jgi:hypothetical protein